MTVASRLHPEMEPLGIREGAFKVTPNLDEAVGYSSNALPGPYRLGSWEVVTAPSLTVQSLITPLPGVSGTPTMTLTADAYSGNGSSAVGVAGAVAINAVTSLMAALVVDDITLTIPLTASGRTVSVTATNTTHSDAIASSTTNTDASTNTAFQHPAGVMSCEFGRNIASCREFCR